MLLNVNYFYILYIVPTTFMTMGDLEVALEVSGELPIDTAAYVIDPIATRINFNSGLFKFFSIA